MTTSATQQDRPPVTDPTGERQMARKRIAAKRKFWSDVVAYVIVNAFLVTVWAIGDRGAFWPGWVLSGWGALLLLDAYRVFRSSPITDADIDRELRRRS